MPTAEQQHALIQQARINGLLHVKFLANSQEVRFAEI
jgi:hypothetical protein